MTEQFLKRTVYAGPGAHPAEMSMSDYGENGKDGTYLHLNLPLALDQSVTVGAGLAAIGPRAVLNMHRFTIMQLKEIATSMLDLCFKLEAQQQEARMREADDLETARALEEETAGR